MEKAYILHMFTSEKNLSPFDVNMALDAGWNTAIPYTHVEVSEITSMVQDTIFSRGPKSVRRTGIFIGGRDVKTAMDMIHIAQKSMIPPFEVSVFADPSGSFTTAAAMVAIVEHELFRKTGNGFSGVQVLALGGTGPVGQVAAVLASRAGAHVTIVGRQLERAQNIATLCNEVFGGGKINIAGAADSEKAELLKTADVVFATAAAGVQVLSAELIAAAPHLKVAADVNAVPPSGIAGLDVNHNGVPLAGSPCEAVGYGALAIGNIKYQTQNRLLNIMHNQTSNGGKPAFLHYEQAFEAARLITSMS